MAWWMVLVVCSLAFVHSESDDCQTWDYTLHGSSVYFYCSSNVRKFGYCPTTNCEFPHVTNFAQYETSFISCKSDKCCPNGFRCCADFCFHRRICRPVRTLTYCKDTAPTLTTMPPAERTTTEKEIDIDGTEGVPTRLPPDEEITGSGDGDDSL